MNKLVVYLLGFVIFATGCQREVIVTEPPEPPSPTTDSTLSNVAYGDDVWQKMDVYLPAFRSAKTKTIIYLHAGAWCAGDKNEGTKTALYFQKKGYGFISMNYRLTTVAANINPAQMRDIEKALNFISARASEWNISGDKICLSGTSAGAHLSLLYSYKYKADKRVKAVMSICGPTDLADSLFANGQLKQYIEAFVGYEFSQNKNAYLLASPVNYLSKNCVPTLLMHGTADKVVPYSGSVLVYDILKSYGVNVELRLFERLGHDLTPVNDELFLDMEKFLKTAY